MHLKCTVHILLRRDVGSTGCACTHLAAVLLCQPLLNLCNLQRNLPALTMLNAGRNLLSAGAEP